MKVSKLIFSIAICLTGAPSLVDAWWTGTYSITSLELYPGDGTSSRKPVAVINMNGYSSALEYGNDNRGGDLVVQTLMHAYAGNKQVNAWVESNRLTYYYQTNGTTWSMGYTEYRITALSVAP